MNNKKGVKLLAAVMAFAMVFVAGVVLFEGSSDSDATNLPTSEVPETGIAGTGNYIVKTNNSTFDIATGATGTAVLVIPDGMTATINGKADVTIAISVYTASTAANTTTYSNSDSKVVLTKLTGGSITITAHYVTSDASTFTLSGDCTVTSGIGSVTPTAGKYTIGQNGLTVKNVDPDLSDYGVKTSTVDGTAYAYYPAGYDKTYVMGATATDVIIIKNGSATVSQGTNKSILKNIISSAGITITGVASGEPKIEGSYTAGSITMDTGVFIVDTNSLTISTSGTGVLNAYADGALSSGVLAGGKKISATTTGLTVSSVGLWVYGDVASNQSVTLDKNKSVTIVNASVTTLEIKCSNTNEWMVSMDGSVTLTTPDDATITNTSAVVVASADGDLTLISGYFSATSQTVSAGDNLVVSEGATLTVVGEMTVTGDMNVYGTLLGSVTITVSSHGTVASSAGEFRAFNGSNIASTLTITLQNATLKYPGVIDIATGTAIVKGEVRDSATYGQSQIVVVEDYYDVKNNSTITIKGGFEVPEGTTVTIYSGSKIDVQGTTSVVNIAGKIIVEAGAEFAVSESKDVNVTGTIESDGTLTFSSNFNVKNGGSIDSQGTFAGTTATIGAGSELRLGGQTSASVAVSVKNAGTVIMDEVEFGKNITISNIASGAIVKVISYQTLTANTLTIDDNGMKYNNRGVTVNTNSFVFTVASGAVKSGYSGITVTSSVILVGTDNTPTNMMDISGSVGIYNPNGITSFSGQSIVLNGNGATIADKLTLGENVNVTTSETGTDVLTVSGTLTAVADSSAFSNGTGMVTVTGQMTLETNASTPANVNAAYYKTKDASESTIHNYTTLAKAIEAGATDIKTYGTLTVLDNVNVPAGTTVDVNGTMNIGATTARDVKVTFANGATLKFTGTRIAVDGTLEFENKKDNRASSIVSDVSVIGDVASKYTNIYTALGAAVEGDVVTITKQDAVTIDADITVKAGVTLSVPAGKSVKVNDNVTVTVDGTVIAYSGFAKDHDFTVKETTTSPALVVNGKFLTGQTGDVQAYYKTYGAYYVITNDIGTYTYIAPLTVAVEDAQAAGALTVYGDNKFSSVKVEATQAKPVTITFAASAVINGDIEISNYVTIDANSNAGVRYDGTIKSAVGEIDIVNMKGFKVQSSLDANKNEILGVYNTPVKSVTTDGAPTQKFVISGGVVTAPGTTANSNNFVATGAGLSISADATLRVTGAMTAENGMTVGGTLEVANGATFNASYVQVDGSLIIAEAVTNKNLGPGSATITTLYIGISKKGTTGAAASVSAPAITSLTTVYLGAGATISEDLLDSLVKSTKFVVDGADYMTVYTSTNVSINGIKFPTLDGAEVDGWQYKNSSGKLVTITATADKNVGDVKEITALMDYDVYKINIVVDSAITDVYLDGELLASAGGISKGGVDALVSAGTHQITYKLKAGYGGDIKVTFNGQTATDGKFTISKDMDFQDADGKTIVYKVTISGAVLEPIEPTPVEKDDGMGITDYLLIVLVILAAILVVVVAIRMMRS